MTDAELEIQDLIWRLLRTGRCQVNSCNSGKTIIVSVDRPKEESR